MTGGEPRPLTGRRLRWLLPILAGLLLLGLAWLDLSIDPKISGLRNVILSWPNILIRSKRQLLFGQSPEGVIDSWWVMIERI